jgi:phosphonate transport system substrate-binding protein
MAKRLLFFGILVIFVFGFSGCAKKEESKRIDLTKKEEIKITTEEKPLRIAVSAMISPKETLAYYKEILDYLGKKLKMPVELVQRETYAEVNDLMERREIEVGFVCAGPYLDGKRKFGMELLVAPVVHGETVYYSYLIVHKDSPLRNFEELRAKSFAFTDPNSNTGCLVPRYELAKIKETPDSFFGKYIFTKSHDNSIKAIAEEVVDAAAVDSLIWEYANAINPEFTSQTKIIKKLGPFGIPPVAVHPNCDPEMKEEIKQILLDMDKDEDGRRILGKIFIDKFIIIDDSQYDSVRQMQEWLEAQK